MHMKALLGVQEQSVGHEKVVQIHFMGHGIKSLLILYLEQINDWENAVNWPVSFQTSPYDQVTMEFSHQISNVLWREHPRVHIFSIQ